MTPIIETDFQRVQIKTWDQLNEAWPFLLEGLVELNKTAKDSPVSPVNFHRVHSDIVTGVAHGVIFLINSKNGKPLCFITGIDASSRYRDTRELLVYAIYSNRKSATASRYASRSVEFWAKGQGYDELIANSYRLSGSMAEWAQRFHGFVRYKVTFRKKL